MSAIPRLDAAILEALCKILADTSDGLTGGEIGALLTACGLDDPGAGITKWRRLLEALDVRQTKDGYANRVLAFALAAMLRSRAPLLPTLNVYPALI